MSEETLDLARKAYEVFNQHDWDAFFAMLDEEVVIESRLVAMEGGYHGHEGARRWRDDVLRVFPDYTVEARELRDLGDITFGHCVARAHSSVDEGPLLDQFWHPIAWRDGKVVWWANCATEEEAHEAIARWRERTG